MCSPAVEAGQVATLGVTADNDDDDDDVGAPAGACTDEEAVFVFDARDVLGAVDVDTEAAATVAAAVAAAICCIKLRLFLARLMPTDAAPLLTLTGGGAAAGFAGTDGNPTDPAGSP